MEDYKISKAKKEDLKYINKIYIEGVKDEYPKNKRKEIIEEINKAKKERLNGWKKDIKSNKSLWLVTKVNKEIVGFASAEIKEGTGQLNMLYVKKDYRERGIGKTLTKDRLKWLKIKGAKFVYAGMLIGNKKSISNLKKFGFSPVSIKMEKIIK